MTDSTTKPSLATLRRDVTGLTVAELVDYVRQLESHRLSFVKADIEHLRELATLNRMADLLAIRRSRSKIIRDVLGEAARTLRARDAWIIEPDSRGGVRAIHGSSGPVDRIERLPLEARDLFERAVNERPEHILNMPPYDPEAPPGLYLALPVVSGKHLMGVFVAFGEDGERLTDSHYIRLLRSMLHQTGVASENAWLFETLSRMIVEVVIAMALAIESRDPYTGGHVTRVTAYSLLLAQQAGVDEQARMLIRLGGLLHDIGKVAVPDAILRKPGWLTPDESKVMETHTVVGHQIISPIPQLQAVAPIVRHHHERFDGRGYPDGLIATDIPFLARIGAVADTFDAMTSDRPYRKGRSIDEALLEIRDCAGTQFDPDLAHLFVQNTAQAFANSVEQFRQWRETEFRADAMRLIDLLEMDHPLMSEALNRAA